MDLCLELINTLKTLQKAQLKLFLFASHLTNPAAAASFNGELFLDCRCCSLMPLLPLLPLLPQIIKSD